MSASDLVLDPAVRRLVDASSAPPFLHELGPHDSRLAFEESQGPVRPDPAVTVEFRVAPVGPSGLVGFWIFQPKGPQSPAGAVLYAHGSRWMIGDGRTHHGLISELAKHSGQVFVVPEFTRTPEARYPVAVEELYAMLEWAAANGPALGLDTEHLSVAGDCAGATMAGVLALLAERRGGPRLRAQVLFYPLLDPDGESSSHREFGSGYLLTHDAVRYYWRQYCDGPRARHDSTLSPLRASTEELSGLPPALVVVAEADPVRDEGEQYANRLRTAGVGVTAVRYLGVVHDFVSLTSLRSMPAGRAAIRQAAAFLREAVASARGEGVG